ncbi:hypothetical protein Q5P01_011956 [Channa striata]|uniref:Secreted protein n=1 Tax=Channa striata TaxID=64152 RepID=A0AA88MR27_CHASR|nr:hypothetical protein Q5P01_011956 [Channa striata]
MKLRILLLRGACVLRIITVSDHTWMEECYKPTSGSHKETGTYRSERSAEQRARSSGSVPSFIEWILQGETLGRDNSLVYQPLLSKQVPARFPSPDGHSQGFKETTDAREEL